MDIAFTMALRAC